jgi:hypothetical protein
MHITHHCPSGPLRTAKHLRILSSSFLAANPSIPRINTIQILKEYRHYQANEGPKVNCMHSVARQHLLDTEILDFPKRVAACGEPALFFRKPKIFSEIFRIPENISGNLKIFQKI